MSVLVTDAAGFIGSHTARDHTSFRLVEGDIRDEFTRLMAERRPIPVFGDGSTSRDYTYVADIVAGVVGALDWVSRNPATHEVVSEEARLAGSPT